MFVSSAVSTIPTPVYHSCGWEWEPILGTIFRESAHRQLYAEEMKPA